MTTFEPSNPLIVQSDHTVLVEVDSPRYEATRNKLVRFAELVKSPEHIHTYRITPLSIWNARAATVAFALPLISGPFLLAGRMPRKWHCRGALLAIVLTVTAAVTGAWMLLLAPRI